MALGDGIFQIFGGVIYALYDVREPLGIGGPQHNHLINPRLLLETFYVLANAFDLIEKSHNKTNDKNGD